MINQLTSYYKTFALLSMLLFVTNLRSQCAGLDNTITVCDKDQDISTRSFDLFSQLGGSPAVGGTWSTTNPANFFALNTTTGEVDLWRINNSGVHQFIYTNDSCGETATISINLGGYSGENNIDGSANACSDNPMVNLHGFLGSEIDGKVQDFNGVWEEDPGSATGFLIDNVFDAFSAGPGVYTFTYTVPAIAACSSSQSTVVLEVHPAPNPGNPISLEVCTNEDLSTYTNFDLNSLLVGEDSNGTWSEFGTGQLVDLTDHEINIQEINQNFGYGTYTFRYTVYPTHPVCTESSAEVQILISPVLDGSLEDRTICSGSELITTLTYDNTLLPSGEYTIEYTITDNSGTKTGFSDIILSNGSGLITIDPTLVNTNELAQVNIVGIDGINPTRSVCSSTNVAPSSLLVLTASALAIDSCPNTDLPISISNILNSSLNVTNEIHDVNFDLSDPMGNITSHHISGLSFTNGGATLLIPAHLLSASGPYSIVIDIDTTMNQNCLNTIFTISEPPEEINLSLNVNNSCDATLIDVLIDAPILSDGSYSITYEVTPIGSTDILVNNSIAFNGGTANYQIDLSSLNAGDYTVILRSDQDDTTPCRTVFEFEEIENFAIGNTPEIPEISTSQVFCANDFPNGGPTLNNINVNATGTITYYQTENSTTPIPLNTELINGATYYVSSTNPSNNCSSSERAVTTVSIVSTSTPISSNTSPFYCFAELATLANLEVESINNQSIIWYDQASGGTILANNEILVAGHSYFAAESINGGCESSARLEFTPTIHSVPQAQLSSNVLSACGMDSPTVADLFDLLNETSPEVDWYDSPNGTEPLLMTDALVEGTIYYLEIYDSDTGCVHPERTVVTIDLSACNPDEYGFYVPDGFSPNSDGRNDTFFIPNIEVIFPDFTFEIFNRYGSSLFKGNRNNPFWDGENTPNGVYFYVINFNKEGFESKQGRLYLNR